MPPFSFLRLSMYSVPSLVPQYTASCKIPSTQCNKSIQELTGEKLHRRDTKNFHYHSLCIRCTALDESLSNQQKLIYLWEYTTCLQRCKQFSQRKHFIQHKSSVGKTLKSLNSRRIIRFSVIFFAIRNGMISKKNDFESPVNVGVMHAYV